MASVGYPVQSQGFNQSLLAKQAWRIWAYPNTLVAQVFKHKYFPQVDFLDSSLRQNGSYNWSSIWSSKSLFKEGLGWRVGDGRKIRVWQDKWILEKEVCRPPLNNLLDVQDRTLDSLIDEHTNYWNVSLIDSIFDEHDCKIIKLFL